VDPGSNTSTLGVLITILKELGQAIFKVSNFIFFQRCGEIFSFFLKEKSVKFKKKVFSLKNSRVLSTDSILVSLKQS
jgi:hypothetical protein